MLFQSLTFLQFFLVVFTAFCFLRRFRLPRNVLLLCASYFFYGSWGWRYMGLLAFCTLSSWAAAVMIERSAKPSRRTLYLWLGVGLNVAALIVFKYLGFFTGILAGLSGGRFDPITLLLPIGISFYTFQAISHVVDVYRKDERHCHNLLDYALFISFFPQLVAGPIERAGHIVPQLRAPKPYEPASLELGFFLIVWGLFKKLVVADNLAPIADAVFGDPARNSGFSIVLGVLAFAFQIYCDFSGYTDIARGVAKFFGIELSLNFRLPYFARDPSDFWQRWHITLSTWIRDYLYIPLGGNRSGGTRTSLNLVIAMGLAGLWHGAAWNFIFWGLYHGLLLLIFHLVRKPLDRFSTAQPWSVPFRIAVTFLLVLNGWILFRAGSPGEIAAIYSHMGFHFGKHTGELLTPVAFILVPFVGLEWFQHRTGNLVWIDGLGLFGRSFALAALLAAIFLWGLHAPTEFIYFQF